MPTNLSCPKCAAPMELLPVGDVMIDRCTLCRGIWLDRDEKEKLVASRKAAKAADAGAEDPPWPDLDTVRVVKCPRDGARMVPMSDLHQPHVHFEQCSICGGVFLDAGELADLSEFTLRERLRRVMG